VARCGAAAASPSGSRPRSRPPPRSAIVKRGGRTAAPRSNCSHRSTWAKAPTPPNGPAGSPRVLNIMGRGCPRVRSSRQPDVTPYDMADARARAQMFSHGQCGQARRAGCARQDRGARPPILACREGSKRAVSPSCSRENTRCQAGNIIGVGKLYPGPMRRPDQRDRPDPPTRRPFWMVGATGARGRGRQPRPVHVRVTAGSSIVAGPGSTRSIRASSRTQLSGAAIMQLGFNHAGEDRVRRRGRFVNASLRRTTRFPSILDIPSDLVSECGRSRAAFRGRFGAKGGGGERNLRGLSAPPSPQRDR